MYRRDRPSLTHFLISQHVSQATGAFVHTAVPSAPVSIFGYRVDTDYMRERVTIALGKIGDPEAVRRIRSVFAKEPWDYKNYTSIVLSGRSMILTVRDLAAGPFHANTSLLLGQRENVRSQYALHFVPNEDHQ